MPLNKEDLRQIETVVNKVVDTKIDSVNKRIDIKIDGVNKLIDKKIDSVNELIDKKIDSLAEMTARGFEEVNQRFKQVDQRFDRLEEQNNRDHEILERKLDAEMKWRDEFASPKFKDFERRIIRIECKLNLKG